MQKLNLTLIPMCIGMILLFFSWYISYPVSIDSQYDFAYNHISWLYWLGLPILFASFFIVAIKTKNNTLRWLMTVSTVLLMYSTAYFSYMIPGSDAHQFRGLTEYFISTGDLSLKPHHSYYAWPLFFILNKVATSIMGLDLRYFEFILYGTIGFVITSFIYLYTSKAGANGYIATITFFIILSNFFNYQWAPFSFSMVLLLLLFSLDSLCTHASRGVHIAMLVIFTILTYTHILVPGFCIAYFLFMYIAKKNGKYLSLFLLTLVIYTFVQTCNLLFPLYVERLTSFHILELLHRVEVTVAGSVAPQPYIDIIAQFFSRTVVITTTIVTGLGFLSLLIRSKLRKIDYAILLAGTIFAGTSLVGFKSYPGLFNRALPLVIIPASLGASHFCESRFKKYIKPISVVFLVLFTFAMVHKTFYDRQIFFQTKSGYNCANFMIYNIDWKTPSSILSHFRFMQYLKIKSSSENVMFGSDRLDNFSLDMNHYNYVVYTVGLGKSFLRTGYSVEKSFTEFEINHFNLIYNSGDFSYIFSHDLEKY